MRSLIFEASDGFPLHGTLLEGNGDGPAVLMSPAAAVPGRFYRHFADRLIQLGASKVLTYDYRGVARSIQPKGWKARINMKDWGTLDLPAALDTLKHVAGTRAIVGIGHSFGGVALGLSNRSSEFQRYTMLASLSGYYRNTAEPLAVFAKMNLLGVPLTIPFGKLPKWGGLGEALPGSVFRDWARWCRNPNFLFADPKVPEARHFKSVRTPILSVGVSDDVWGTRKAVENLLVHYTNAPIRELWLAPQQDAVGHLGFFRKQHESTLWPPIIDWLLHGHEPQGAILRQEAQVA